MRSPQRICILAMAALLVWSGSASAWGPRAQLTLIDFAMNLLAEQTAFPLRAKQREIRQGVMQSEEYIAERYPNIEENLGRAISSEMQLLQRVGRAGFDLYYAFRLGVLGKLVAMAAAPMQDAPAVYQRAYEDDVDAHIENLRIDTGSRQVVDPNSYVEILRSQATARDELITKDYQEGTGFDGVARESLSQAASRTVEAVADVWYTLLATNAVSAAVSDSELRNYALGSIAFYMERTNLTEIEKALERMAELVDFTSDMRVAIGDLFYAADFRERAMEEYRVVLDEEPGRREVVEKIAAYYTEEGNRFLESDALDKAYEAFELALAADPASAAAQTGRMETEQLIEERRVLYERYAAALEDAANFEAQAEEHAVEGYFVEAIAAFNQAMHEYEVVTPEFPELYNRAQQGLRVASGRIQELRSNLMENVAAFSGSADVYDVRAIADMQGQRLDQEVLRSLVEQAYRDTFQQIEQDTQPLQRIETP